MHGLAIQTQHAGNRGTRQIQVQQTHPQTRRIGFARRRFIRQGQRELRRHRRLAYAALARQHDDNAPHTLQAPLQSRVRTHWQPATAATAALAPIVYVT